VRAGGYDLSLPWFRESNQGMIPKLALPASTSQGLKSNQM